MALSQAVILIVGIIAISYAIASETKIVSADGPGDTPVIPDAGAVNPDSDVRPVTSLTERGLIVTSTPKIIEVSLAKISGVGTASSITPVGTIPPATGLAKFFSETIGLGPATGTAIATVLTTAAIAATIYFGVKLIGNLIAPNAPGVVNAVAAGAAGGYIAGTIAGLFTSGWATFGIGAAVGLLIFLFTFNSESVQMVAFQCNPWQAPKGGSDCDRCNNQGLLSCTEYQCRSLGLGCELLNKGTSDQRCVWTNRNDATPPIIKPWIQALLPNYIYTPDNTISPPDNGVKVQYTQTTNGCVPAFTQLQFGVTLNEASTCRADILRKNNISSMLAPLSSGLYIENHSISLSLPGNSSFAQENITIENGGNYQVYVRCEDKAGNSNTGTFVFKYCVDNGPDTTPPYILSTSIINNSPVNYNQSSIDSFKAYVNEPAECRWSFQDRDYDSMENSMSCTSSLAGVQVVNGQQVYPCSTSLTGIKASENNDFYFRCRDQPLLKGTANENQRNTDPQSYHYRIIGTRPLVITSLGPNGTISDSTSVIKVELTAETSAGYSDGAATCQYSNTGKEGSYINFFETETFTHSQELHLAAGNYTYYIKCFDLAGNTDYETTTFKVETDTSPPQAVRAYHQDNSLTIITDEAAECVYNTQSSIGCGYDFDKGISMTTLNDKEHYTNWNTLVNFYVKCKDTYGNQPYPDRCSIIVRPYSL